MEESPTVYYFSSGEFGRRLFEMLTDDGFRISKVITIPDRPAGRGRKLTSPPIKEEAEKRGIPVIQAEKPEDIEFDERPHFIVVADYGKILRSKTLRLPTIAPLNVHPSLLPMYRGAAPIERAMMDGYPLGVSIIVMNEKVDAGEIVLQERVEYTIEETKGDVLPRLLKTASRLLTEAINLFMEGKARPEPQEGPSSYAKKIKKEELWISLEEDYISIVRKINALSPTPTARMQMGDIYLKLYRARPVPMEVETGRIIIDGKRLMIGASGGCVELLEVQPAGKRRMKADEFIRGYGRRIPERIGN